MRIQIASLCLAVLMVPVAVLSQQDRGEGRQDGHRSYPTSIRGSRKVGISFRDGRGGIASGCVIAYGHLLRPPFQVELVGSSITINGVQVSPSLVLQREFRLSHPPEDRKALYRQMYQLERRIERKYYQNVLLKKRENELIDELIVFAKSHQIVDDVEWIGDGMSIRYVGNPVTTMLSLKGQNSGSNKNENKARNAKENYLRLVSTVLRNDQCAAFGAEGSFSSLGKVAVGRVNDVMQNHKLSEDARIESLRTIFRDYGLALDVAENYLPDEWMIPTTK